MISWNYLIPLCCLVSLFLIISSGRLDPEPFASSVRRRYKVYSKLLTKNITGESDESISIDSNTTSLFTSIDISKNTSTSTVGRNEKLNNAKNPSNLNITVHTRNNTDANFSLPPALQERSPLIYNFTEQNYQPLTCSECLNCNRQTRMPKIPSTRVMNKYTLRKSSTFFSKNWGNVLSPYWAARSMAELGGYKYEGGMFGRGTWMEFLPTSAPARVPRNIEFNNVCRNCTSYEFFHKGSCWSGWGSIAPAVQIDTRLALLKHSKRAKDEENDAIFNFFQPNDWLIYNRCCVFGHPAHAPGVLRTYDSIPSNGEFRVFIMTGRKEDPFDLCAELIGESVEYIKKRNPKTNVTILESGTQYVDFARLVFAPNVLVAAVGSSWALWSALLANNNTVVSLKTDLEMDNVAARASLPDSVQVLTVPTLRDPRGGAEFAQNYGIPHEAFSNTSDDREAVLQYFRNA